MPTHYNYYMRLEENENLMNRDLLTRYNKAMIIVVSGFFGKKNIVEWGMLVLDVDGTIDAILFF